MSTPISGSSGTFINLIVTGAAQISGTATITTATINIADITTLNNPQLNCLNNIVNSMFIHTTDVSGCVVSDLTPQFKELICETVSNWCPYYCTNCGVQPRATLPAFPLEKGMENNFNLLDNSNSFFHEEIINDDSSNIDYSIMESENFEDYSKFISKNLSTNENLVNNNLKLISLDKISKGKWLFNGNISIEIPSFTSVSNIKMFVYLNENVVSSGEIDLGSQTQTNSTVIKSHPFNLMFRNDVEGSELKIGIMSFDNKNELKLLKTSNFFANQM